MCYEPLAFVGPNAYFYFRCPLRPRRPRRFSPAAHFANATYQFQVTAVGADGKETIPSALSNAITTSSGGGNQKINLTWTYVPGAVSYNVYACGYYSTCPATRDIQAVGITTNSLTIRPSARTRTRL